MDYVHALLFGLVEGLTEFLPVSSTGHLILTSRLLGSEQTDFHKSFEIAIQPGAILAVVLLYWRSLLVDWAVLKRVLVAFFPTGVLGLVFYKIVKAYLLGSVEVVLTSLVVGGIVLIVFEWWHREKQEAVEDLANITYVQAFLIGLCQAVAMFLPGVSRSAATIVAGLALGIRRKTTVEFSFLLAVPTMGAATAWDLYKSGGDFSTDQLRFLLVGFVTSFVVALLTIQFLLRFIKTHTFIPFGVYRILVVVFWLVVLGVKHSSTEEP